MSEQQVGLSRHSAERLVKSDYRHIDIFFALRNRVLGLQLRPLGIEQRKKIDYTFAIAQASDIRGALTSASLIIELNESRLLCVVIRQSIFRFFQGAQSRLFIGRQHFFRRGIRDTDMSAYTAQVERRPRNTG